MRRVLVTGMSGTGKSTALDALRATTNPYGKTSVQRALILRHLAEVEPLLRATCTHEIDATRPGAEVVAALVQIGGHGG